MMSDGTKKKIMIKRKTGSKSPVTLNKPADQPVEQPKPSNQDAKMQTQEAVAKKESASQTSSEVVAFKFYCVYCGQKLSAKTTVSGKRITCPACQRKIVVPTPPES